MSLPHQPNQPGKPETLRDRRGTYLLVVVVELFVVLALWALGRHFSG